MPYSARQVSAESVEPQVLELWRQTRQNQLELENTFRWYYGGGSERDNRCFVVEHTDPVSAASFVGATGLGVRRFQLGSERVGAGLLGDFFVHRAHRSLFPALSLQRAATLSARLTTAFVYGFPNEKALPVFLRLGFSRLGTMARVVRVLDFAPYLNQRLRRPWLARGAARLLNGVAAARRLRVMLPALRRETAWVERFDARFDELDRSASLGVHVRGERSASFLNWRFVEKPGSAPRIFTSSSRRTGALRAYAVLEVERGVAHLRDVFGRDWAAIDDLLARLERELVRGGARSITCNALARSPLCAALGRAGYVEREATRQVILSAGARELGSPFTAEAWHLTDADEDQ